MRSTRRTMTRRCRSSALPGRLSARRRLRDSPRVPAADVLWQCSCWRLAAFAAVLCGQGGVPLHAAEADCWCGARRSITEGGDTFYTDWEETFDSFDTMSLHENLLRGIYACVPCPAPVPSYGALARRSGLLP